MYSYWYTYILLLFVPDKLFLFAFGVSLFSFFCRDSNFKSSVLSQLTPNNNILLRFLIILHRISNPLEIAVTSTCFTKKLLLKLSHHGQLKICWFWNLTRYMTSYLVMIGGSTNFNGKHVKEIPIPSLKGLHIFL